MSRVALSTLIAVASLVSVKAQGLSTFPATPLADKHFAYPSGIVSRVVVYDVSSTHSSFLALPSRQ